MNNIYLQILDIKPAGTPLVLATIARTTGSTPQKPGSSALFGEGGLVAGTVGGGTLEGSVHGIAKEVLNTKKSGYYHFNLDHDIHHDEGAICGGRADVLIDANPSLHLPVLQKMRDSIQKGIPGVLVTKVSGLKNEPLMIEQFWIPDGQKIETGKNISREIESQIRDILQKQKPYDYRLIDLTDQEKEHEVIFLLDPLFPLPKLVIAGAGHIGKALAHLGNLLDFEVTVIDDRAEYANRDHIPDADYIMVKDIGKGIQEIHKTSDTYIVIVTRGHKDDAGALRSCIGTKAGYIGMIGSKGKVLQMRENFISKGWATQQEWDKVFTPIGLEIQSKSVQEIAVSIAAQLVLVRNKLKM